MSRINEGDIVKLLQPGMNTKFMQAIAEAPQDWRQIADFVPSTLATETYPWLGGTPDPSTFNDERKARTLSEHFFSLTNTEYELTVAIKRSTLDDDQTGQLMTIATRIGRQFGRWYNKQVFGLLPSGFATVCYDGQFFFDNDHSEGSSGVQNNFTTSALTTTTYAAGRAAMMNFLDDNGNPVGSLPNLMVVPGGLEQTAFQIVKAQTIEGAVASKSNVYQGSSDILITPWLTDTNNWYLLDTKTSDKPLILQERIALEAGFDKAWKRAEIEYGGYWRGAFGYGDWRRAYGGNV